MAIRESLLYDEVLPFDVALFRQASPENIEMGAPRTGATDLQPADARYPGSPLRLQGRYGEQAYAESKNRRPDPHTGPIHLHGMASGALPPSSVMTSRRLTRLPRRRGQA